MKLIFFGATDDVGRNAVAEARPGRKSDLKECDCTSVQY